MSDIRISGNTEELARRTADVFVDLAAKAIQEKDFFSVSLSGGSTPKALYALLASAGYRERVAWPRVYFFFGDERNVPEEDERSNYRMAREVLFEPLKINESNVINWITELGSPQHVAEMYDLAIQMAFDPTLDPAQTGSEDDAGNDVPHSRKVRSPIFDLFLLGLGTDGHTASLFPHTKALHEDRRLAVENWVPQLNEFRFTMTFAAINNTPNVIFLVSGDEKADMVTKIIFGESRPDDLPAQRVKPVGGELIWMLDEAAATGLPPK